MKNSLISLLRLPSRSLSAKLSLAILLFAMPIFILSLGMLFKQSRIIIRNEAIGRANSVLDATMERIHRNVITVETATNAYSWQAVKYLHPDSLLAFSYRVVRFNPHIDGCSISTEPEVFPQYGRYFSVYTVREKENGKDSIVSVIEEQYEYFEKTWYKLPHDLGEPRWVVFFDEADSLELTLDGMVASYSVPLYDDKSCMVGIISTDLSLLRLSKLISEEEKPYPNSYFALIDKEGRYLVHPDSTRLFTQTIFDGADPRSQADIIALGHEMTAGNQGCMSVNVDGEPCLVCYQPLPSTEWSLALVSPDSDVLAGYHRQTYIIIPLLVIGLILILFLCHRTVTHAIKPINVLLDKTQSIAGGNMEVYIPRSEREDAVGRLQNSFATMLQSLNFHMGSVRYTAGQARQRNDELMEATRLVEEADRQKTAFIQNVSHQIRTPLNIIMGFSQILKAQEVISEDDTKTIADTMRHNATLLYRLVLMLFDSSETAESEELLATKQDRVSCNDVAREAVGYIKLHYPEINILFQSDVDDEFCILTSHVYLMRSLREILYNSAKYSDGQHVAMTIKVTDTTVRFIVEDTGKGISESDHELMFKFFAKVDDLSEGLGLGLPLSKRHAQNLGGDLILDETYHDGCRFILELPLNQ